MIKGCGHLYMKHWEQMGVLNIRPQFGLVLAHLAKFAKMYELMDAKELASLNNTLQLVRPVAVATLRQRSAKRQGTAIYPDEEGYGTNGSAAGGGGGVETGSTSWNCSSTSCAQPQGGGTADDEQNIIPSKKSGSWGGHSGDVTMLASPPQTSSLEMAASNQRLFTTAQTC
jgi:hypothetical protein